MQSLIGRRGIYVRFGTTVDEEANRAAREVARYLTSCRIPGLREIYPGLNSSYIEWEEDQLSEAALVRRLQEAVEISLRNDPDHLREIVIPVSYDGDDLDDVARQTGLARAEVIRTHLTQRSTVFAVGAAPGQPFLGVNDARLELPRRRAPRSRVPAGSVAIAGRLTTIYRGERAGGWSLIGTTFVTFYDPHLEEPCLFRAGDRIKFCQGSGQRRPDPEPIVLLPPDPMFSALRIEEPGPLDLVVDNGRTHVAHLGLAEGGPMDPASAKMANELVGNPPTAPVIESTVFGPTMTVLQPVAIAAVGRGTLLHVGGKAVGSGPVEVPAGARISLGANGQGARGYLAIAGGIQTNRFLGSASVDLAGLIGRKLIVGDVLGIAGKPRAPRAGRLTAVYSQMEAGKDTEDTPIRLLFGPQYSVEASRVLGSSVFTVTTGDRSGILLEGPSLPGEDVVSESPPLGSVEVTSGGQPIILMNDRQRSAGYSKPAIVDPRDLTRVAQLRPGSRVRFCFPPQPDRPWYLDGAGVGA